MQHTDNPVLVVTTRGPITENRHRGAAAIVHASGDVIEAWGDTATPVLPRSSVKILQALPLLETGAADRFGLGPEALALACASHEGAPMHTDRVSAWLREIGLNDDALLCGPQRTRDRALRKAGVPPTRLHNNCSGKHAGFLSVARHLGLPESEYLAIGGGIQSRVAEGFAEMTGQAAPLDYGIDGCSAPNFAAGLEGLALAMARLADPSALGKARGGAASRLVEAMRAHPLLISGEGRACAALITATEGRAVVKTGADGVFTGILPGRGIGFCLKIDDGNTQAAEALCAALLARLGVLETGSEAHARYSATPIANFNGEHVGDRRVTLPN